MSENHEHDATLRAQNKVVNLIGRTFGRWTVIEGPFRIGRNKVWECECRCGKTKRVYGGHLNNGASRSCGCLNVELTRAANITHGATRGGNKCKPVEYNTWTGIHDRCKTEKNYAGRGIKVCQGWCSYETFLSDMGNRPSKEHSIERMDNDGNYSCGHCNECFANNWPANCKWATLEEQANNKRSNIHLSIDGITMTAARWERHLGARPESIAAKKKRGLSDEEILRPLIQIKLT